MTAQTRTQVYRAIRLFLVTFASAIALPDITLTSRAAIISAIVAAVEVVWRSINPAIPPGTTGSGTLPGT